MYCLIFSQAKEQSLRHLNNLIQEFYEFSGQTINWSKSSVIFPPNFRGSAHRMLADIISINLAPTKNTYLGLPLIDKTQKRTTSIIGRVSKKTFADLIDKTQKLLTLWYSRLLSRAGWATLVKHVLDSLPVYTLSSFALPQSNLHELKRHISRFFWNHTPNRTRIHYFVGLLYVFQLPSVGWGSNM